MCIHLSTSRLSSYFLLPFQPLALLVLPVNPAMALGNALSSNSRSVWNPAAKRILVYCYVNKCEYIPWTRNCSVYNEPITSHALGWLAGSRRTSEQDQDEGYGTSAWHGVPVYSLAFTGPHCAYPPRDGQIELT